jgi:hypothetical protein
MAEWPAIEDRINRAIVQSPLSEVVTYTSHGGTPRSIRGVFNPTSIEVDAETSALVRTNRVVLSVRLSELEKDPDAGDNPDEVTARGVAYRVVDVERIGDDWAELHLHVKAT